MSTSNCFPFRYCVSESIKMRFSFANWYAHHLSSGAFLLLYVLLMMIVGIPLFFLELAAGQAIRQGSIGVWRYISPRLAGIGYSSCVVR